MADNKLDKRIVELRRDLDIVSQIERQAQDRLDGKDEAWNKDREHAIEKMFNLVASVKPEDPPSKAVHVLGQLIAEVEKIRAPKRITYDAHKLAMGS
ncbi:MAG: hypothetical protein ACYTFQ_22565 [Planctomycetota bacterium]|jgi:hypothetical protein